MEISSQMDVFVECDFPNCVFFTSAVHRNCRKLFFLLNSDGYNNVWWLITFFKGICTTILVVNRILSVVVFVCAHLAYITNAVAFSAHRLFTCVSVVMETHILLQQTKLSSDGPNLNVIVEKRRICVWRVNLSKVVLSEDKCVQTKTSGIGLASKIAIHFIFHLIC